MTFKDHAIQLIISNSDSGAGTKGAGEGPEALIKELTMLDIDFGSRIDIEYAKPSENVRLNEHPFCKNIEDIISVSEDLSSKIKKVIENGNLPLIFTGDHSNAVGGVSGVKNANPDKRIGVIWIDAHADLHSPYSTPSGNIHGMPLAALIDEDNLTNAVNTLSADEKVAWQTLKTIGNKTLCPKINPIDVVFIGLRDAEAAEWDTIEGHQIKTYEPEDIKEHGIYYVLNHGLEHLSKCDLIYVSFDADSLDPSISEGTGTTAPNGLKLIEAEIVFKTLMNIPNLAAFEITEINPKLDKNGRKMANVIASLIHFGING